MNQDIQKKGWITPSIQDLDISETKGGYIPSPVEDTFDFPEMPPMS